MKRLYNVVLLTALCVLFCAFSKMGFSQSCTHTINLTDTWGDGWNGGAVSVSVGGLTVLTNITITLAQGGLTPISFNFFASNGENIRVYRTVAGSYPSEMRVQIVANNTVLLNTVQPVVGNASSGGYTCSGYCSAVGGGCVNSIAYGSSSAPSTCNNIVTFIDTYQNEYNTVTNVSAGDNFTVNSPCGGWVTVRYGSYNGSLVSSGGVPLTWNATNSGSYYLHWNTNANCGTATNSCNTTITKICAPASPNSISSNPATICTGQSATLTVNGNVGTTYWFLNSCGNSIASSAGSGNNIVVSPALTTTYYARNYNGQWSSNCASAIVTVNSSPAQPLNPTSNFTPCSPVTITRTGSPPAGETWYWQGTNPNGTSVNSGSGPTYTAYSSGTYYLRAMNSSGCWSSQSASIYVAVELTPDTPASPTSNSPQCGNVSLNRVGNLPAGEIWYWQGTNANGTSTSLGSGLNFIANTTGTYYIRAMNTSGCWSISSSSVNVIVNTLPTLPINPVSNSPQCGSVLLTRFGNPPAGETWYWQGNDANGTSTLLGSGVNYTASVSGVYYMRSQNTSGCWSQGSSSVSVTVNYVPNAPPQPTSNSPQCNLVTITRTGTPTPGDLWYWQGNNPNGTSIALGSAPTYNVNNSGTYYIRSKTIDNCWSINSLSTFVTVYFNNSSMQTVSACDSYTWINGVTYLASTNQATYTISGSTIYGCDSTLSLNLTINPSFSIDQNVNACETYTWIDGNTYTQSTNTPSYSGTSINGCDSTIHLNLIISVPSEDTVLVESSCLSSCYLNGIEYTQTGTYYQTLQDQFGCDSIVQLNLIVESADLSSFEQEIIKIYPNPTTTIFTIDGLFENEFFLFDASGRKINSIPTRVHSEKIIFGEDLPSGIYYLQINRLSASKLFMLIKL